MGASSLPIFNMIYHRINKAMMAPDSWVIAMDYVDRYSTPTHRIVSPIRWVGANSFLGLCLTRESPRTFYLSRCKNIRLKSANDIVAPITESEMDNQWYEDNLNGDFGGMTDEQLRDMRSKIESDKSLSEEDRIARLEQCDNAIATIERGEQ